MVVKFASPVGEVSMLVITVSRSAVYFLSVSFSEIEAVVERYRLWTDCCIDFKDDWTVLNVRMGSRTCFDVNEAMCGWQN